MNRSLIAQIRAMVPPMIPITFANRFMLREGNPFPPGITLVGS
jgi:hypothetical protein